MLTMILKTAYKIVLSLTMLTMLIFNNTWKIIPLLTTLTTLILNTRYNFITDYADYADFRDYSTWKIISPVSWILEEYIPKTTQDYIKNTFIADYADCSDYQDHLKNCFIMNTLTTLIRCLLWLCRLRWYSTLREK